MWPSTQLHDINTPVSLGDLLSVLRRGMGRPTGPDASGGLHSVTVDATRTLVGTGLDAWVAGGTVGLAGEVDVSNHDLLASILSSAQASGGQLLVDLRELSFIDLAGTRQLVELARRLAPDNQVRLLGAPPCLWTILRAVGWADELQIEPGPVAQ